MATHVERSIEVEVPVRTAYDQWTQFEEFPQFMAGVREVRQIGDAMVHWVADIGGIRREWDAAILEQVPDEKVAWATTTGATNAGAVYFESVGADRTRVRLTFDFEPEGVIEHVGDMFDIVDRQVVADLDRFKVFIEQTRSATGAWRGTVEEGRILGSDAAPGVEHNGDPVAVPAPPAGDAGEPGRHAKVDGWVDPPGASDTGAATDPVGEDWSDDPDLEDPTGRHAADAGPEPGEATIDDRRRPIL